MTRTDAATNDIIATADITDALDSSCGDNGATAPFRPLFNPATSERIQFTAIAQDSDEDIVRFNWRSMPGGAITEHLHPHREERFTIMAGEAHLPSTVRSAWSGRVRRSLGPLASVTPR